MKKRITVAGLCIVLGVVLMFSAVFAGSGSTDGYDVYKQALKNTALSKSGTINVNAAMTDNGKALVEMNSTARMNHDGEEVMNSITHVSVDGKDNVIESYVQDGKAITKMAGDETYYVINNNDKEGCRPGQRRHMHEDAMKQEDKEGAKVAEMILDGMVGDLKNYFVVDNSNDGSRKVSLELTGSQIPPVLNGIAAMAAKDSVENAEGCKVKPFDLNMHPQLPKLVEDVQIKAITMKADITKDQVVEKQYMNIILTGKDENGQQHEVICTFNMSLSDLNNTVVNKIDLTGKTVKVIEAKDLENDNN